MRIKNETDIATKNCKNRKKNAVDIFKHKSNSLSQHKLMGDKDGWIKQHISPFYPLSMHFFTLTEVAVR